MERRWPSSVGFALSLLYAPAITLPPQHPDAPSWPIVLLPDDDSTFLIDISSRIADALIAVRTMVHPDFEPEYAEPFISVTAFDWHEALKRADRAMLALWTANARGPLAAHLDRSHILSRAKLAEPPSGEILLASAEEHMMRIYGPGRTSA